VWQNIFVVLCSTAVAFTFRFRWKLEDEEAFWALNLACALIVALGTVASLASIASSIVVDKDWVAVIAVGDADFLARINSTCRSIDLAIGILAPILVGQVMHWIPPRTSAIFFAAWNVGSFFVEYGLLVVVYEQFPALAVKDLPPQNVKDAGEGETRKKIQLSDLWKSWRLYLSHDVRYAGLSLACLYLTVLGFDSITVGFAYSQGVSEAVLGLMQSLGAMSGLLASFLFPALVRRLGVEKTGIGGFSSEVACLTLCVASIWAPGSPFDAHALSELFNNSATKTSAAQPLKAPSSYVSVVLLLTGIISSRFGLWLADLSVNQVLQGVTDDVRGVVYGVQNSVNMMMNTAKFVLVIWLPTPATFGHLIGVSFTAVCTGWFLFAVYAFRRRLRPSFSRLAPDFS